MKVGAHRVLDGLPAEEPCLGAVFTSYSFDPAFFEEHVLRAVLRLTSDPVEHAERYHQEARRALQEVPVAAFVDAGERQPGRRLPYDLLEVSQVVFHPKSALLLYAEHARLLVGSGNLTRSGYGGNAELFLCLALRYDDPADAALLRAFDAHLGRIEPLARRRGAQLQLVREALGRRVESPPAGAPGRLALLDSTRAPVLDQLLALLPDGAVIESIGMLAPFYERDDGGPLDATSVFGALAPRAAPDATLDVGVSWDNAQVHAGGEPVALEDGLGRLWSWRYLGDGDQEVIDHLVPVSVGRRALRYLDHTGQSRRWPLDDTRRAVEERHLWMQPPPEAYAPARTIEAARERFAEVRLWLHPATRLVDGRPVHRPLHAKLLVVAFRAGRTRGTLVVVGSANMSRRALLQRAAPGQGNVELCLAFRLEGTATLRDLAPELIRAPSAGVPLRERAFPELARNWALAIAEATHDPAARTLIVTWSEQAADLPAWTLTYDGDRIAGSGEPPAGPVVVEDFALRPASAEVVLRVGGGEHAVPILVTDLAALPAAFEAPAHGLEELLMLLGRRIGAERAIEITRRRGQGAGDDPLAAFFGEGFSPTDVFRAWWSVAEDLGDAGLSVPAFRLRLEGAQGAGAAWAAMRAQMGSRLALQPATVWLYGAELVRTLAAVELPPGPDHGAKARLLAAFCARVRAELDAIDVDGGLDGGLDGPLDDKHDARSDAGAGGGRRWVDRIRAFYRETTA